MGTSEMRVQCCLRPWAPTVVLLLLVAPPLIAQIVPEPSEEVYAAVAYMLNLNGIIDEDHVIDAKSLLT